MIDANFYHACYGLRKRNTYLTQLKCAVAVLFLGRKSRTMTSQTHSQNVCRIYAKTASEVSRPLFRKYRTSALRALPDLAENLDKIGKSGNRRREAEFR